MAKPKVSNKFVSKVGARGMFIRGISEGNFQKYRRLFNEAKLKNKSIRQSDILDMLLETYTKYQKLIDKDKKSE